MMDLQRSSERGRTQLGWLDSRHSFAFGSYRNRARPGFRSLRVINEDWVAPGTGFGLHPHRDMEILSFPLEGVLAHADSEGGHSELRPGRLQFMRAGRGIVHSEMNPSSEETAHLLQIWIEPDAAGLEPLYLEADLDLSPGRLVPLATPRGEGGGFPVHQDVAVFACRLDPGQEVLHALEDGRHAWVQWTRGHGHVGDLAVEAGDGVSLSEEPGVRLRGEEACEALVFDLA